MELADVADDLTEVLLTETQIHDKIAELARRVEQDYAGERPLLVGVLKGAVMVMADVARELKMPLYSDTARTAASQGFWEKQERKGRAKCAKKGRGAAKINMNHASGAVIEERGRWACQEYVLKPTAADLSGLKRKPARKRRAGKRAKR